MFQSPTIFVFLARWPLQTSVIILLALGAFTAEPVRATANGFSQAIEQGKRSVVRLSIQETQRMSREVENAALRLEQRRILTATRDVALLHSQNIWNTRMFY